MQFTLGVWDELKEKRTSLPTESISRWCRNDDQEGSHDHASVRKEINWKDDQVG